MFNPLVDRCSLTKRIRQTGSGLTGGPWHIPITDGLLFLPLKLSEFILVDYNYTVQGTESAYEHVGHPTLLVLQVTQESLKMRIATGLHSIQ